MTAEQIARSLNLRRTRDGEYSGECPCCGYKSGFFVKDGRDGILLIACYAGGCTFLDLVTTLRRLGLWPDDREARPAQQAPDNDSEAAMRAMWGRSRPGRRHSRRGKPAVAWLCRAAAVRAAVC